MYIFGVWFCVSVQYLTFFNFQALAPTDKDSLIFEEMLNDVEAIAQLDWLWSSKLKDNLSGSNTSATCFKKDVVQTAHQELNNVDNGCDKNTIMTTDYDEDEEDYLQLQIDRFQESQQINVRKIKPIQR